MTPPRHPARTPSLVFAKGSGGQVLKYKQVIDMEDGILPNTTQPFPETTLEQVAACLPYHGKVKTIAEMNEAIRQGAKDISSCQVQSP